MCGEHMRHLVDIDQTTASAPEPQSPEPQSPEPPSPVASDPETAARCIALIAAVKQIPAETITSGSTFDELGMDSLDRMTLAFDVEESYDIAIPESRLATIHSVGDMVAGVEEAIHAKASPRAASAPGTSDTPDTPDTPEVHTPHLQGPAGNEPDIHRPDADQPDADRLDDSAA
jgi:acyl carrier protein